MTAEDAAPVAYPLIWPLCILLFSLFVLRKVGTDLQPVVRGVVGGVAKNAQQYALMYAMGMLYATAAGLQSLGEVATQFQWVYVAAFAKVAQPMTVAVIAYVTKPPAITQAAPDRTQAAPQPSATHSTPSGQIQP